MTTPTAHTVFDRTAATYDAARAKLIPPYERFYGTAVELIPFAPSAPIRVLDLGTGTGLLSAFVRARFPNAHLHLVDLVDSMLERAHRRLGTENITYAAMDYGAAPIPISPGGPWNTIVSALSIHHLTDDAKHSLFEHIHGALAPGGVFVNAEQVAGPTPELTRRYHAQWLMQIRERGATDQEIADADCWFKDGRFAVLAGTRGDH